MDSQSEKQQRLAEIKKRIQEACVRAGRDESSVTLIAVSKTKSWEDVSDFVKLGVTDFGENYVQEALAKIEALESWQKNQRLAHSIRWHFIGGLQSNKAKFIPKKFHLLHSLDSLSLALKLEHSSINFGTQQNCLVEVNIDNEVSKTGITPDELHLFLQGISKLNHLRIKGLMCIPAKQPAENNRAPFSKLRELLEEANRLNSYHSPLTELSMGMSSDFEDAILEGATMIRIGTSLFGERNSP